MSADRPEVARPTCPCCRGLADRHRPDPHPSGLCEFCLMQRTVIAAMIAGNPGRSPIAAAQVIRDADDLMIALRSPFEDR